MANREDLDVDDDFSELYKEYTGPPRTRTNVAPGTTKTNKRSHSGSDEEDEVRDPNTVPTDFTSREAKVWEAKSKATERNWKKRKEEEFVCKICGEFGHFTQGCPSTLGANRKSQDFFERVPARDPHVKALFPAKVISTIEKDTGCKIKSEEKFIIVSGKDRLILAKGIDAVYKIKNEGDKKIGSSSNMARSRSPEVRSPISSRMDRSDSQRSNPSPRNSSRYDQRFSRPGKNIEERVHEDLRKLPRGSPQGRDCIRIYMQECLTHSSFGEAYGNDGARGRSTHSKSPPRPHYTGGAHSSYDGHNQSREMHRNEEWDTDKRGPNVQFTSKGGYSTFPHTLEELHLEYKRDAIEITKIRDKEEDEENIRHREAAREMRENYMKRFAMVWSMHGKKWEEFLQVDAHRRQQRVHQQIPAPGLGGYKKDGYFEYENALGNPYGANMPMDSRVRYPNADNYPPSRSHDSYGDFQHQRHDDYGKAYNNRF